MRRSEFSDSEVPPPHIVVEPTHSWALDLFVATMEMRKHRLCHLDGEMARNGEEWSLAEITVANDASSKARRPLPPSPPMSSVAAAALHTPQEKANRIIRERHAATGKPCRDAATFHRPNPETTTLTPDRVAMTEEVPSASPTWCTRSP